MAVAEKLLHNTFGFGVTNIPVCSNGVFVYTPAVQRLLQLSANIYDAANTNAFPVVFRPLFANDAASDLFIIGFQQVTNVSGMTDPQLSAPHDPMQLLNYSATNTLITDAYGPVNAYGVPWIIGAKKGLPGFSYGITDAAYEAIPAQLLPLLRPDSIGTLIPTNGGWNLGFSGADGYDYLLQTSTNLVNWLVVSTNHPVQGSFIVPIPAPSILPKSFYRSVLLP